jgi:DNA-binding HxlR family transcriptional regulator
MPRKSYQQYCAIATALDRVGDRWTLLILRELWLGEFRFTDLRMALPGIAPNLLTERLRQLEHDGLVEQRELPAPAARTVYALTAEGLRVGPVLRALARFGLPFLDDPAEGRVQPRMAVHAALGALFDPVAAAGRDLLLHFELDGEGLWLEVRDGELVPADSGGTPNLTFVGSATALVQACRGGLDIATAGPRLRVEGGALDKRAFAEMFPFMQQVA